VEAEDGSGDWETVGKLWMVLVEETGGSYIKASMLAISH
jgi:hypothetical protein